MIRRAILIVSVVLLGWFALMTAVWALLALNCAAELNTYTSLILSPLNVFAWAGVMLRLGRAA